MSDPLDDPIEELVETAEDALDAEAEEDDDGRELSVPSPSAPRPSTPEPSADRPDTDRRLSVDVDSTLGALFAALVLSIKFGLLALTLGVLFLVVAGRPLVGGLLLAVGLVLAVYTGVRYRQATALIAEKQ